jgi:hypothetical protein
MSARRTENKARERARHQTVNLRRFRVKASRVRPRYPARNPASARDSLNAGLIGARAVDGGAVFIGHLRGAGAREGWADRGPALNDARNVLRPQTPRDYDPHGIAAPNQEEHTLHTDYERDDYEARTVGDVCIVTNSASGR